MSSKWSTLASHEYRRCICSNRQWRDDMCGCRTRGRIFGLAKSYNSPAYNTSFLLGTCWLNEMIYDWCAINKKKKKVTKNLLGDKYKMGIPPAHILPDTMSGGQVYSLKTQIKKLSSQIYLKLRSRLRLLISVIALYHCMHCITVIAIV